MKIAILDDYQDAVRHLPCFSLLKEHEVKIFNNGATGIGQLAIRLAPFEALVLIRERTQLSRALLNKLPHLKVISQTGKVSGHIDLDAAKERGITILEGTGDPHAPAELTWALIMAASRKLPQYAALLQEGVWQTASLHPQYNQLGRVLRGRQLGIWGYGKIGQLIANYGRAFGMHVVIWGSEASRARAIADGFDASTTQKDFFAESDVLSLHLRLNEQTRGLVSAEDLARMKPDALFVNTSRAELVAPGVLLTALKQARPGFAALDVFEQEPVPKDNPFLQLGNVLLTPHLGYVKQDSYELYFSGAFRNLLNFIDSPKNQDLLE